MITTPTCFWQNSDTWWWTDIKSAEFELQLHLLSSHKVHPGELKQLVWLTDRLASRPPTLGMELACALRWCSSSSHSLEREEMARLARQPSLARFVLLLLFIQYNLIPLLCLEFARLPVSSSPSHVSNQPIRRPLILSQSMTRLLPSGCSKRNNQLEVVAKHIQKTARATNKS